MKPNVWIDLSRIIRSGMPVYPGDPQVKVEILHTVRADHFHMNLLSTAMHAGTHLDAPLHFLENGDDVASIPLDKMIGPANVIRIDPVDGILRTSDLRTAYLALKEKHPRLLISTGWEKRDEKTGYFTDYPAYDPELPVFLKENGIVLLGSDMPSVKYHPNDQMHAHRDVLGLKVVIVESLIHLDQLPETVFFVGLPLKIEGMDGSLIRAAARISDSPIR